MKLRHRSHYHNGIRLPFILFIIVVGGLVGTRWMNEVRTQHLEQRLCSEARQLEHDAIELQGHIKDLQGRASELLTRDAVNARLQAVGKPMKEIQKGGAISISAIAAPAQNIAQNTTPTLSLE